MLKDVLDLLERAEFFNKKVLPRKLKKGGWF